MIKFFGAHLAAAMCLAFAPQGAAAETAAAQDQSASEADMGAPTPSLARFDWFEYSGDDELFRRPLAEGHFRNPILTGYYPDPSVVAVGEDYYMVNSTFGFWPGLPVFHSRDLVNWTKVANAVDRPEMMPFDGVELGKHGLYAPTIEHHAGTFYILNTCVACGGNFVLTAKDPAGPWSDPIWMPHIGGIDPALFVDDDGRYYVVHNERAPQARYPGHTVIRAREVHPETFAPLSESVILWDGGDETPWNTNYLEGPHLYKIDGKYLLSAPGGGTGFWHQQLVFKSDNVFGPYEAFDGNPILTQHGLPDDRPDPITATGHGDIFQDASGDWWIVFLGNRVYDLPNSTDPGNFHTGRETFLLPVTWRDGWPIVLDAGEPVPLQVPRPNLPDAGQSARPATGNYTVFEEFDHGPLGLHWLFARAPREAWWSIEDGALAIQPRSARMGQKQQPSFVGQRLAHMNATTTVKLDFSPHASGDEAGLMAVQSDRFYIALGLGLNDSGQTVVRLRARSGEEDPEGGQILAEQVVDMRDDASVYLRMHVDRDALDAYFSFDGESFAMLYDDANAKILTSRMAGGFTGAVIGPYAETAER